MTNKIQFTINTPDEVVSTINDTMMSHLYEADNVNASLDQRRKAFIDLLEFLSKQTQEIATSLKE